MFAAQSDVFSAMFEHNMEETKHVSTRTTYFPAARAISSRFVGRLVEAPETVSVSAITKTML